MKWLSWSKNPSQYAYNEMQWSAQPTHDQVGKEVVRNDIIVCKEIWIETAEESQHATKFKAALSAISKWVENDDDAEKMSFAFNFYSECTSHATEWFKIFKW